MRTPPTISIMIAEDHQLYREGLLGRLKNEKNYTLLGSYEDGQSIVEACQANQPDVILMDLKMPILDGIEASRRILSKNPEIKIIALTMFDNDDTMLDMLRAGARGYILKNADYDEFHRIILEVYEGHRVFCKEVNHRIIDLLTKERLKKDQNDPPKFTSSEIQLLEFVCKGLTSKEIGLIMKIPYRTVEGMKSRLLNKMDVPNSQAATIYAIKHKLVDIEKL